MIENEETPRTLTQAIRYFGNEEKWSLAFYTYSHETYEPCDFNDGSDHGTPEAAFDIGAVYLTDS